VQASVIGRVEVGELAPDLERLLRSARARLVEDERPGPGHRDAALGLAHAGKLERAAQELLLELGRRVLGALRVRAGTDHLGGRSGSRG
jgi:hypothetical protein